MHASRRLGPNLAHRACWSAVEGLPKQPTTSPCCCNPHPATPHAAGFHNASLYGALEPAIVPLVQLLRDEEVRGTRHVGKLAGGEGEEVYGLSVCMQGATPAACTRGWRS